MITIILVTETIHTNTVQMQKKKKTTKNMQVIKGYSTLYNYLVKVSEPLTLMIKLEFKLT